MDSNSNPINTIKKSISKIDIEPNKPNTCPIDKAFFILKNNKIAITNDNMPEIKKKYKFFWCYNS